MIVPHPCEKLFVRRRKFTVEMGFQLGYFIGGRTYRLGKNPARLESVIIFDFG